MSTTFNLAKVIAIFKQSFLNFVTNLILPTPYRESGVYVESQSLPVEYTNYQKKEDLVKVVESLSKVDLKNYDPKKGSILMVLTFSNNFTELISKLNAITGSIIEYTTYDAIRYNVKIENQYLDLLFIDSSGRYIPSSKLPELVKSIQNFTECIANYNDVEYGVEEHNLRTLSPVIISLTSIVRGIVYCSTNQ